MKKYSFTQKTVVLTGASSGLGKELAKVLITAYGCTIYGIGRSAEKLAAAESELGERFHGYAFDVSMLESWEKLSAELEKGGIRPDVLINCAGILPKFQRFEKAGFLRAEEAIRTNYLSQVYAVSVLLPLLKQNEAPAIVNISSSSALCPFAGVGAYSASKAASERFSECLAAEERDVYVATVLPGFVKTDIMRGQAGAKGDFDLIAHVSADCGKTVRKIVKRLRRRKKRIVVGADAHFMSVFFRLFPNFAPRLIGWVLKTSKLKLFEEVFE